MKKDASIGDAGVTGRQPRETCQMCQGTGRTAFVLPNLLHEEVACPNCDAGKGQVNGDARRGTYDR